MSTAAEPPVGRLAGRLVALGVTGSISAYKSVELLRLLTAEGADVVALLTPSATRFVAPLSLEALSRRAVESDVLALMPDGRIGHVVVADTADAVVVAPATAHWLGAMANGLAADVVTATCLATTAPVVVAPAMDGEMYAHPATQANVRRLRDEFGYAIVGPQSGPLASGAVGVGRLADLPRIVDAVVAAVGARPIRQPNDTARPPVVAAPREADLAGRRIVVSAGGTQEAIDPVRFIGNRSSGRMGVAIARAALDRGATVTLVAGAMSVDAPAGADVVHVESTADLRTAVLEALPRADALIMAAAVADFRPRRAAPHKLARGDGLVLELEPTEDVLAEAARTAVSLEPRPILVGFAAEAGSLERAPDKLRRKGVDLLVGNDVTEPGSGFGTDTNRVTIFDRDGGADALPLLSKRDVADRLLDRVTRALDERDAAAQTVAR
ncbi:MAG TPA: bifunctional phosphopantothenoylcysteine decarboxylase/phosphopantothenate--cysteine ligase CoaBC [Candidatus Limnocylindrales bacterium]|nr:bifunctional phosphopantothenoylcysteine decarboxylase/phosphopantothenate--cysteine ligase CoaBC [Candidatus Limnocylindrales bacterium]